MRRIAFGFAAAFVCFSTVIQSAQADAIELPPSPAGQVETPATVGGPMLPEQLEAIFMSACLNGSVKLEAGQESPIDLSDLPPDLRTRFGKPDSGQVWRLNSSSPSYLYVIDFHPTATTSPRVCGLATESIKIEPAIQFLGARVNGPSLDSLHEGFTGAEWLNAQDGYVAVASRAGSFTVLEVKQLSKEQQRRALKKVPNLAIAPPTP